VQPAVRDRLRLALLLAAALLSLAPGADASSQAPVAVFPVENLSGGNAPVEDVRQILSDHLARNGVPVLAPAALEAFLAAHRVRYTAGLDAETAAWLRQETGVERVVVPTIELSMTAPPPKFSLIVRVISATAPPLVVWADDVAMAGDQKPGWFDLGLVNDYPTLEAQALDRIAASLLAYLRDGSPGRPPRGSSRFAPKTAYRQLTLDPGRSYTIAVVPFLNLGPRRNAGEILSLLCMRHLSVMPQFRVLDAGVVRQQLLDARIIMTAGLSVTDADTLAALVDADYVLGGRVLRYEDHEGTSVRTHVEFSAVLIDPKTRRVVWSSDSDNDGNEGLRFFDRGASRTAHAMATQMVQRIAGRLAGDKQ
jgi:TolB-like protein